MGPESDLGSNEDKFWYWSRRDRHPGLYYANHEDYYKTRLKTPFNPVFMRESLGLDEIDLTDAKITKDGNETIVTKMKLSATGKKVLWSAFIDDHTKRMNHMVIADLDGKMLASCEVEYVDSLPSRITYNWHEEHRSLILEFKRVKMNLAIDPRNWQIPDYQPKIDMGRE